MAEELKENVVGEAVLALENSGAGSMEGCDANSAPLGAAMRIRLP